MNTGTSGQKKWAENQMKELNKAQSQYSNTTNIGGSNVPSSTQSTQTTPTQTNTGSTVKATYNNQSYDIDLNKDYSTAISDAVAKGDYAGAAQNEAYRNAKINYLNENNSNTYNAQVTNDYGKFNTFSDLPDTWTSAVVGGNTYTKDQTGKMYNDAGNFVGDGYNILTNEFTFTNDLDAKNAMYSALKEKYGLQNATDDQALAYLTQQGVWNQDMLNAYKNGTVSQYWVDLQKKQEEKNQLMQAIASVQQQSQSFAQQQAESLARQEEQMNEYLESLNKQKETHTSYNDFTKTLLRKNFIY